MRTTDVTKAKAQSKLNGKPLTGKEAASRRQKPNTGATPALAR